MTRRLTAAVVSVLVLATGRASAHPVGGTRFDAPVPLWIVLVGAGVTVAATAVVLAVAGDATGGSQSRNRQSGAGDPRERGRQTLRQKTLVTSSASTIHIAGRVAGIAFLVAVAAAVADGLAGPQTPLSNLATLFVWPLWLKGIGLVAIVAGTPWRVLSPWRTVYRGLSWIEGDVIALRSYPSSLGSWPALAGVLILVGIVENLTVVPRSPAATARVVAVYAAVMIGGALLFGRVWFARADPLEVLYGLLGRAAPFQLVHAGDEARLVLRRPWRDTARPVSDGAVAAVVVAAVYTVSFDGFAVTSTYQSVLFAVPESTGIGSSVGVLLYLLGFVGFLLAFWAVARLVGDAGGVGAPVLAVAPTVIPIAAAYELAHNYSFVLTTLGRLPVVVGWHAHDPLAWLSLPAFWASQVLLIVGGHVVAVVAAHRVVTDASGQRTGRKAVSALRAHAPLVVLMVGYTVISLWIVSQPVVA